MASPTLDGKSLGNVKTIIFNKDPNIIPISFPGQDSDSTEVFDLLGVLRTITVAGSMTGSSTSAVKTQVDAIADLVNGDQETSVVFVSDELGTLNVKLGAFDVTWEIPSNHVTYTLKLFEGV